MNKYLSAAEKENLVRLLILDAHLDFSVKQYAETKSTDKSFLADLRRGKTFLHKAIDKRLGFLFDDAKVKLAESVAKIGLSFLPKVEARKELERTQKLKSVYPIDIDDMQDWIEFMVESACKTCQRCDYAECQGRKVLIKYDIAPWMPEADGCCQYSYVEGVLSNEPR